MCRLRPAPDVAARDRVAANTAVVPVTQVSRRGIGPSSGARPEPFFVAHLLAMAASAPQTRKLRQADHGDAETAYRVAADQNRTRVIVIGRHVSQTA